MDPIRKQDWGGRGGYMLYYHSDNDSLKSTRPFRSSIGCRIIQNLYNPIHNLKGNPVKFMTFANAMEIVSQYGYANKCESLLVAISDMEYNWDNLSLDEIAAYNIIIGEYDMVSELS